MRLLVLGGTAFVGRAITELAVARGHDVTVLNRGHHDTPAGVTARTGDRTEPAAASTRSATTPSTPSSTPGPANPNPSATPSAP